MKVRQAYLENRLTLSNSGVKTIPLDFTDPISQLMLTFRATNGATSNKENPLAHNITKIEIVDGGEVITSVRGEVLRGLVTHLEGKVPWANQSEIANEGAVCTLPVPFGRFYLDTEYALNPRSFRNLQLKISYDLGHIRTISATSYVTATLDVSVIATLMEDVPAPKGVLTFKEVSDFTSAANGDARIEMPTDYPWRTLVVRAYENGTEILTTLSNLKLSADGGKFVAFDVRTQHLIEQQLQYYGLISNTRHMVFDSPSAVATYMAEATGGQVTPSTITGVIIGVSYWWLSDVYLTALTHGGSDVDANGAFATVHGTGFENCVVIPMGLKDDPATWFNAPDYRHIDLFLTQGSADAEIQVAVQEARPY